MLDLHQLCNNHMFYWMAQQQGQYNMEILREFYVSMLPLSASPYTREPNLQNKTFSQTPRLDDEGLTSHKILSVDFYTAPLLV